MICKRITRWVRNLLFTVGTYLVKVSRFQTPTKITYRTNKYSNVLDHIGALFFSKDGSLINNISLSDLDFYKKMLSLISVDMEATLEEAATCRRECIALFADVNTTIEQKNNETQ